MTILPVISFGSGLRTFNAVILNAVYKSIRHSLEQDAAAVPIEDNHELAESSFA